MQSYVYMNKKQNMTSLVAMNNSMACRGFSNAEISAKMRADIEPTTRTETKTVDELNGFKRLT